MSYKERSNLTFDLPNTSTLYNFTGEPSAWYSLRRLPAKFHPVFGLSLVPSTDPTP